MGRHGHIPFDRSTVRRADGDPVGSNRLVPWQFGHVRQSGRDVSPDLSWE